MVSTATANEVADTGPEGQGSASARQGRMHTCRDRIVGQLHAKHARLLACLRHVLQLLLRLGAHGVQLADVVVQVRDVRLDSRADTGGSNLQGEKCNWSQQYEALLQKSNPKLQVYLAAMMNAARALATLLCVDKILLGSMQLFAELKLCS